MRAGPELEDGSLKRSPTAQQLVVVTQVTPASEVISTPGTLGMVAVQTGEAVLEAVPASAGTTIRKQPQRRLATVRHTRERDILKVLQT
jgi:hypothetical protein